MNEDIGVMWPSGAEVGNAHWGHVIRSGSRKYTPVLSTSDLELFFIRLHCTRKDLTLVFPLFMLPYAIRANWFVRKVLDPGLAVTLVVHVLTGINQTSWKCFKLGMSWDHAIPNPSPESHSSLKSHSRAFLDLCYRGGNDESGLQPLQHWTTTWRTSKRPSTC
jgi:hypothetical protein